MSKITDSVNGIVNNKEEVMILRKVRNMMRNYLQKMCVYILSKLNETVVYDLSLIHISRAWFYEGSNVYRIVSNRSSLYRSIDRLSARNIIVHVTKGLRVHKLLYKE